MSNRNATGSWHGYSHQAKVGILLALRKIKSLLNDGNQLKDWKIEFESAEDIDIKFGDKVDSRHQVKTYKNGVLPNDYKDVLEEAYSIVDGSLTKTAPQAFQYRAKGDDGAPGEIEVEENSRYLHTIVQVRGFGLSEEEFKKAEPYANYIENPNKVQLYKYSNTENFCDFSNIDQGDKLLEYCKIEIESILTNLEHVLANINAMHKTLFLYLVDSLDNKVREEHLKVSTGYPTMYFTEILEIIQDYESRERTNTQIMREVFMSVWDEYEYELEDNHPDLENDFIKDRRQIINDIYLLDDEKFNKFIIDLNPEQKWVEDLSDEKLLSTHVQSNSLKDVMYKCLVSIIGQPFDKEYLGYKDGKYTLTLINRNKGAIQTVINSLADNTDYLKKIYERNFLINGQITNQLIGSRLNTEISTINPNWEINKNHIMNPKMKFITVEEAIKKINEG